MQGMKQGMEQGKKSSRKLIVNADDLGFAPGRDRGILRACDAGIVSSVSLLANGSTCAAAAAATKMRRVGVGVHLNLSEGRALSGSINGLTDAQGNFYGKHRARSVFAHAAFDPGAALRELKSQVETVLGHGIIVDHVDYHQHMGLFPATMALVLEVCRQFGIKAARLCAPAEPPEHDPSTILGKELDLYRRLAAQMRMNLQHAGIRCPDGIWGMPQLNRLHEKSLCALLEQLPPGHWELMVHPGDEDPGLPFCTVERKREQEALISSSVREIIARRGITLTTFGDLCAHSDLLT